MPGVMTSTAHVGRALLALAAMPDPPPVVENARINALGEAVAGARPPPAGA